MAQARDARDAAVKYSNADQLVPPPADEPSRASKATGSTVPAVGPGRYCSPRHGMPFNSRHEGATRASGADDVAGNICQAI